MTAKNSFNLFGVSNNKSPKSTKNNRFKFIIIIFSIGFLTFLLFRPRALVIDTNTTWNNAGSPYYITENTYIRNGATLNIDASSGPVEVRFTGNYRLEVSDGLLDVNGTSTNSVTFMHDSSSNPSSYYGLYVDSATGVATIEYADIKHANYGVNVNGGDLDIYDSTIQTNRYGIAVYDQGSITTRRNVFKGNTEWPIGINPDCHNNVDFGTGADADVLGDGGAN
ncbi:hypothetical protein GF362_06825, partial [Candidatus Dojkabacteria bacterium]|nr:hypothetical protein [Candidatus Dojkabacteria bacterium]